MALDPTVPIRTLADLEALCADLQACEVLAIDTEFIREQSFMPKLELVQVASSEGLVAAIDYGTLGAQLREGRDPFKELLLAPGILKVFHAADQDLEVLCTQFGTMPSPVFDTQVAAGFVGHGAGLGYGALVEAITGTRLQKGEKLTDWSRRPLTPEQIAYALDDVRYLLPVYEALRQQLRGRARLDWAVAECEGVCANVRANLDCRADPRLAYLRVKGRGALDAKGLAILRELTAWRDEEARRQDRPRGSILKDELLVEVGRRAPRDPRQLSGLRGFHPRELERYGRALCAAVERALATPRQDWPRPEPRGPVPGQSTAALADLLQAVTHYVATESGVASTLLATRNELQRLAAGERDLEVLQGWRRELLGARLLAMVEGTCSLAWDPRAQTLLLVPQGAAPDHRSIQRS